MLLSIEDFPSPSLPPKKVILFQWKMIHHEINIAGTHWPLHVTLNIESGSNYCSSNVEDTYSSYTSKSWVQCAIYSGAHMHLCTSACRFLLVHVTFVICYDAQCACKLISWNDHNYRPTCYYYFCIKKQNDFLHTVNQLLVSPRVDSPSTSLVHVKMLVHAALMLCM